MRRLLVCFLFIVALAPAQTTCIFTVTPDHLDFPAEGGDMGFKVTSNGTCGWSGSGDQAWISVVGQSISNGQGSILFRAIANQGAARAATLTVAGLSFPAKQAAGVAPPTSALPVITSGGILNAANYAAGGLVPGEIITIFGDNLGPATLAPPQLGADGSTVFTTLGGTQVLIAGQAAPLIFSLKTQVSAIVPYGISNSSLADVQVKTDFVVSNTVTMPVAAVNPALFSLDATGKGPGAILNQNNTVNSATNPAHPGDIVLLYGTGDGLRTPALMEGQLTPLVEPLPRTAQPVQVTIGGKTAQVAYAGGAPGLVAGLLQINVKLPDDVALGNNIPVVLTVGAASSPAAITLAITGR